MIGVLMVILSYVFGDIGRERFRGLDGEQTGLSGRIKRALLKSACRNGLVGIARYLIRSGVDINGKSSDGMTALDISVISEQLECMKLLMESGAEVDVMSCVIKHLMNDVNSVRNASIEYLISLPSCPRAVKIQALELLGAASAVQQSRHYFAHQYWLRSLEERAKAEPRDRVQPKSRETHPVYGNAREFQTMDELDTIALCEDDMWMQALIVRERIHGFTHHFMATLIQRRAIAYLSSCNFDKCIGLVSHIIDKQRDNPNVSFDEFFINLPYVMTQNLAVADNLVTVFIKAIDLLDVILTSRMFSVEIYEYPFYGIPFNRFELYIYCIVDSNPSSTCEEELRRFHQSVWKLLQMYPRGDLFHGVLVKGFYSYLLHNFVDVLIKAGANPVAVDCEGNTPVHLIAMRNQPDKLGIIRLMLSNCCHCVFHVRNADRKLFTYYLTSEMVVDLNKPFDFWQLQCLAAKALAKSRIPYASILPNKLVDFVKYHGTGPVCGDQP